MDDKRDSKESMLLACFDDGDELCQQIHWGILNEKISLGIIICELSCW